MSEYQYFEFQTIDRPLTQQQMAELRGYSTRAEITSTRFVNEYNWGSFKGDPRRWMETYFDAFVHVANWGTHWLMLRVPTTLIDRDRIRQYAIGDEMDILQAGEHRILSFSSETEEPDWEQGEGWLSSLIGLRAALLRGDYRSLYLGWLAAIWSAYEPEDSPEPPVPPGLGTLDAPHQALVEFLRIPPDLLAVAAERSGALEAARTDRDDIGRWVSNLSEAEKDALLTDLLLAETPHPLTALKQRVDRELHAVEPVTSAGAPRMAAELIERAGQLADERAARQAAERAANAARKSAEAAAQRKHYLASLRGQEDALWRQVDGFIELRHASAYQQAVRLLQDLRELAGIHGEEGQFEGRMQRLSKQHSRKPALIKRFERAGLLGARV